MSDTATKLFALIIWASIPQHSAGAYSPSPPSGPVPGTPAITDGSAVPVRDAASQASLGQIVVPDSYKEAADGSDDAPSIQRAINAACAGDVKTLLFHARRYRINSPITQNCLANWEGQGYDEQAGPNYEAPGTWLDVGASFSGSPASPINIVAGAGSTFENFGVAEPSQPAPPIANYDPAFPAGSARPRILGYTPSAWSPAAFPFVFSVKGSPGNLFRHVLLDGINQGFHLENSGRTNFEDVRGQVFNTMFDIHESYDVSRITDVHNWPYWSSTDPVMAYDQENAHVISSYRNDSPFWDNIFGFGVRDVLYLANDVDGTTTGIQAGKISCDSAVYCIRVNASTPVQVTGQVASMRTFGSRWITVYPAPLVQYPGSSMLQLDSSAVLQIGSMENFGTDAATVSFNAPKQPSNLMVGSLFVHANQMSPNSLIARFPTARASIPSLLTIGMVPAIAGTVAGFHNTNTPPNGTGIGTYQYSAAIAVH